MTRILLDKNIVRYWTIALFKLANNRSLLPVQRNCLLFVQTRDNLFISKEIYNILTQRVQIPQIIPSLLRRVQILYPTKYFKRWVRCIQETTSLTREDAVIVAYGTFSTSSLSQFLGTNAIATTDKKLAREYHHKYKTLDNRLMDLVQYLDTPWNKVSLPQLLIVEDG